MPSSLSTVSTAAADWQAAEWQVAEWWAAAEWSVARCRNWQNPCRSLRGSEMCGVQALLPVRSSYEDRQECLSSTFISGIQKAAVPALEIDFSRQRIDAPAAERTVIATVEGVQCVTAIAIALARDRHAVGR